MKKQYFKATDVAKKHVQGYIGKRLLCDKCKIDILLKCSEMQNEMIKELPKEFKVLEKRVERLEKIDIATRSRKIILKARHS